jgi:hypothetical protein
MNGQIIEQGHEWYCHRTAGFQQEVVVLEAQRSQLEQRKAHSPALIQALGKFFGLGTGEKLSWVRYKLEFQQEQLNQFEAKYGAVKQPELSCPAQVSVGGRQEENRIAA